MAEDMVLLLPAEPAPEDWARVAAAVVGPGSVLVRESGLCQIVTEPPPDEPPVLLLNWWPARQIEEDREARAWLREWEPGLVWIDASVPYGSPAGREIVSALAEEYGGIAVEGRAP